MSVHVCMCMHTLAHVLMWRLMSRVFLDHYLVIEAGPAAILKAILDD